ALHRTKMADSSGLNLSSSRIHTPAYPESNQTPLGTFAASAFESLSGTAVLEYGPTEILPSVGAISKYSARRCRPRRHISRAHPREPWGSRPTKATSPRETDSPLEGSGFEPSVPPPRLSSIRAVRAEIIGRSTDVYWPFARRLPGGDLRSLQVQL